MSLKKITVRASGVYDVLIGSGLLENCGEYVKNVTKAQKLAVITDDNVDRLYGDKAIRSLENAGYETCRFVFPHGEASKNSSTLIKIWDFLCENHFTRTDCLVALGGGVTGDMTGFAAASYLRGIDFVQIPTSLLAQVDSSVGGKTGIDIPGGKNLVGAFKQPILVLADTDALDTLTDEFFTDGMGEVVKYGMIKSAPLFEKLEKYTAEELRDNKEVLTDIIAECVSIKRDVVEADEHDKGERMLLNFGHTLGHSIEQYYNYTGISHGMAVAKGMEMITALAEKQGMCSAGLSEKLAACLEKYHLKIDVRPLPNELGKACLNDKKRSGGNINVVICSDAGTSSTVKMTVEKFMDFLNSKGT